MGAVLLPGTEGGSTAGFPFVQTVSGAAALANTAAEGREERHEERLVVGHLCPDIGKLFVLFVFFCTLLPSFRLGVPTAVAALAFCSRPACLLSQGS